MNALTKQAASFSESMIPQCLENAAMDPTLFGTYGRQEGEGFNFHYQAHGIHYYAMTD